MYSRLLKAPLASHKSFFLFGPRGTGKTTWLKKSFPKAIYINLLKAQPYLELSADPSRLEQYITTKKPDWIIIDEVQKVPELLNEVHHLIEDRKWKFILTGSSARSLRRQGVNLLAGRAHTYHMYPLTCRELKKDFSLKHSLQFGHLPSTFVDEDAKAFLLSYVQTYLREEVLQEGLMRSLAAFARFLEVASFSQGQQLNTTEVAKDAHINRKLAESYFELAEDLLIAHRLPVFTRRAKRKLAAHHKFYFFDVGVFRTLRPSGPLDSPEEAQGAALETLVFQELMALNHYLDLGYKLYYWRTSTQLEVDFVLYGPKGLIAIEVKRSQKWNTKDLSGLKAFAEDYPQATCYLLYGGKQKAQVNGIHIQPLDATLRKLPEIM